MMKITGLSHLFKWENLHNWWLTKYFLPHCICVAYIYSIFVIHTVMLLNEVCTKDFTTCTLGFMVL